MASSKLDKAEAALERVKAAGRVAKRETKARVAVLSGAAAAGAMGHFDRVKPGACNFGGVHLSLIGIPMVFATAFKKNAVTTFLEQAGGPLLGAALYRAGHQGTVLGDEYGNVAGEYDT